MGKSKIEEKRQMEKKPLYLLSYDHGGYILWGDRFAERLSSAAEWMRNTGLFVGEKVSGQDCFYPDKAVSRGEFLAMVVDALDIPLKEETLSGVPEDAPQWLKPYLAASLRSGLISGWQDAESGSITFRE